MLAHLPTGLFGRARHTAHSHATSLLVHYPYDVILLEFTFDTGHAHRQQAGGFPAPQDVRRFSPLENPSLWAIHFFTLDTS